MQEKTNFVLKRLQDNILLKFVTCVRGSTYGAGPKWT